MSGLTATGPGGAGLGYGAPSPGGHGGIPNSVAVKFDLYNNFGEGIDSTGLYVNGASPTIPAIDMTSSGVNLHSGDIMDVWMTYDGTTLSMQITDLTTQATFKTSWAINIPSTVGGNTAYVGFTGGTGGGTAMQDILSWVFTSQGGARVWQRFQFAPLGSQRKQRRLNGTRLRLTDGGIGEIASAWYTNQAECSSIYPDLQLPAHQSPGRRLSRLPSKITRLRKSDRVERDWVTARPVLADMEEYPTALP